MVEYRGLLKPHEEKRVSKDFALLSTRRGEHRNYERFLSKIKELCGPR